MPAPEPSFDGCQIVQKLSSGAVADLYHALQQPLGRPVLIKALSPSILPSSPFAATLEREARVLADLHHANIPHLYDYVRRDDRMWLVLEWVDGWTLDELLKKSKTLPPAMASAIALELSRALDHAHARGVVHRDVQPRNVLVSRRGGVKLMNFAVAVDDELESMPEIFDARGAFGGPSYMSPEQILGEAPDPRSDLFSLGVTLFELLRGERPFDGPDDRATTQRIRHDPSPPVARGVPGIPGSLERVVHRLLAKLPADRFGSARELAIALGAVLDDLGASDAPQAIRAGLGDAALADRVGPASIAPASAAAHHAAPTLRTAVTGLALFGALIVAGGVALELASLRTGVTQASRSGKRLELTPDRAGYLRVVADPWAHVVVDGQRLETTPFARSIPLAPGTHYVRLEHPSADAERRTIDVITGETILLDVKMNLAEPDGGGDAGAATDGGAAAEASP